MDEDCQPEQGDYEDPDNVWVVERRNVKSGLILINRGDQEKRMVDESENHGPKNKGKGTSIGEHKSHTCRREND